MGAVFKPHASRQDLSVHAGIARIAGYSAAIAAETERLFALQAAGPGDDPGMAAVVAEMRDMAKLLAESRSEIIAMAPPPTGGVHLHEAGDTLDGVVEETERAAFEIMNQAERAQAAAARLHAGTSSEVGADLAEVNEAATAITLACIFQDITGQRIRKVISTMREVEARVASLVTLMGVEQREIELRPVVAPDPLANGPSSPDQGGLAQSAVDDLFA